MGIFKYYPEAFVNCFNYKGVSPRAELIWFVLFYGILFVIFKILLAVVILFISPEWSTEENIAQYFSLLKIGFALQLLFTAIHAVPFMAIIKRRLNALCIHSAFFIIFMLLFIIQFVIHAFGFYGGVPQIAARMYFVCTGLMLLCILFLMLVNVNKESAGLKGK